MNTFKGSNNFELQDFPYDELKKITFRNIFIQFFIALPAILGTYFAFKGNFFFAYIGCIITILTQSIGVTLCGVAVGFRLLYNT